MVLIAKVSDSCSALTTLILVDFGAYPALLNNTFNPSSPTIHSNSLAKCSKVLVFRTSFSEKHILTCNLWTYWDLPN